jgi:hypothetical protein
MQTIFPEGNNLELVVVVALVSVVASILVVAAQVEIESETWKQVIIFQVQAPNSRRFQRGFERVNLHRPTSPPSPPPPCW